MKYSAFVSYVSHYIKLIFLMIQCVSNFRARKKMDEKIISLQRGHNFMLRSVATLQKCEILLKLHKYSQESHKIISKVSERDI